MRLLALAFWVLLAGCAADPRPRQASAQECRPEIERLNAQHAAEVAELQRAARAATRREDALRRQVEALKSIERGILEREERVRIESRQ